MSVRNEDSVDKIVKYFAVITKRPFQMDGKTIEPHKLVVSKDLARGYKCLGKCGACCNKFTLDYLPSDPKPSGVTERTVEFSGKKIAVFTDDQTDNSGTHCKHLSSHDGLCGIYDVRPFSCDFELVRCYMGTENPKNKIAVGPYGRSWNMTRAVDQEKGTLCKILEPSDKAIKDTVRKLRRLKEWATHFGLTDTWLPMIIKFLEVTNG